MVVGQDPSGWWQGYVHSDPFRTVGWFPCTYLHWLAPAVAAMFPGEETGEETDTEGGDTRTTARTTPSPIQPPASSRTWGYGDFAEDDDEGEGDGGDGVRWDATHDGVRWDATPVAFAQFPTRLAQVLEVEEEGTEVDEEEKEEEDGQGGYTEWGVDADGSVYGSGMLAGGGSMDSSMYMPESFVLGSAPTSGQNTAREPGESEEREGEGEAGWEGDVWPAAQPAALDTSTGGDGLWKWNVSTGIWERRDESGSIVVHVDPFGPADEGTGPAVYAQCVCDYAGADEGELTMAVGDVVEVYEMDESGWWHGQNHRSGDHGWLPANYVQLYGPG